MCVWCFYSDTKRTSTERRCAANIFESCYPPVHFMKCPKFRGAVFAPEISPRNGRTGRRRTGRRRTADGQKADGQKADGGRAEGERAEGRAMQPGEGRAATTGGRRPGALSTTNGFVLRVQAKHEPVRMLGRHRGVQGGHLPEEGRAARPKGGGLCRPAPRYGGGPCHPARTPAAALPIRHATRQRSLPSAGSPVAVSERGRLFPFGTQPGSGLSHPARNPAAVLAIRHATRQRPLPSGTQPGSGPSHPARNPAAVFAIGG